MATLNEQKQQLLDEVNALRQRYELSKTVGPDYFEPGMMEYLDQSYGSFDDVAGTVMLRFESKGTRYEGRTERIELLKHGDKIRVVRDRENKYNRNNFVLLDINGGDLGSIPASICDALAPLYDGGYVVFDKAFVSFVDPISKRNRHAKQAILFVELQLHLTGI